MTLQDDRELRSVAFSPDGSLLATGSRDDAVRVYDIDKGTSVAKWKFERRVESVVFSRDGRYIAAGSRDTRAAVFDLRTKERVSPWLEHSGEVHMVALNADATLLATGGTGARGSSKALVTVWEVPSGIRRAVYEHGGDVIDVQFAPQGNLILTASEDGTALLWDADRSEELHVFEHNASVWSARFNRTGTLLVTASEDGTARVWDVDSGRPESEPLRHDARGSGRGIQP